jgi:hypothetical protein
LKMEVIEFFHEMYMKGPSSKHNFCTALQRIHQQHADSEV